VGVTAEIAPDESPSVRAIDAVERSSRKAAITCASVAPSIHSIA
jgi:hypothetical protein